MTCTQNTGREWWKRCYFQTTCFLKSCMFRVTVNGNWCASVMTLHCFNIVHHTIELLQYYYCVLLCIIKIVTILFQYFLHRVRLWQAGHGAEEDRGSPGVKETWFAEVPFDFHPAAALWIVGRMNLGQDTSQMLAAVSWLQPYRWVFQIGLDMILGTVLAANPLAIRHSSPCCTTLPASRLNLGGQLLSQLLSTGWEERMDVTH